MRNYRRAISRAFLVVMVTLPAAAQVGPSDRNNQPIEVDPTNNNMRLDFERRFREDQERRRHELAVQESREQAMLTAASLVIALNITCEVTDAAYVATGPATVDGKHVKTKTYEAACANGMGYFLVSQESQPPTGFTCFAAQGQRAVAEEKGEKFADVCLLPANSDPLAMTTAVLARAGTACTVQKLRWIGQSLTSKIEFDEVACTDGKGYMAATPMVGGTGKVQVFGCAESAAHKLPCTLTSAPVAAAPLPTLADFKQALAQHGVACTASDIRVIGKEGIRQRHVVEFLCPEHPAGLIAFIPLGDNPNPFETIDCPTAAGRGLVCKLAPPAH